MMVQDIAKIFNNYDFFCVTFWSCRLLTPVAYKQLKMQLHLVSRSDRTALYGINGNYEDDLTLTTWQACANDIYTNCQK